MCEAIIHRGPDDQGIFVEEPIGLGMRRLSIIDVAGGHQPIQNENGDITVVFNGEIYNYQDLRKDLLRRDHIFKTKTDTEVIVHAYEEDGIDCVKRFNGIFAFAIWDAKRKRLCLARDRMGVKPLYYIQCGRGLAFASEIKALLTLPEVSRTLDLESAAQFFRLGFVPAPRTLFEEIKKIPPGFQLVMEENKIVQEPYWAWDFEGGSVRDSFEDCSQQLQALLQEVVTDQMVSDVPIGAFLSGGIDSSAVVAFMKNSATNGVRTYSIGFDEEHSYHNEAPYAEAVAKGFGTQHQTIIAGSHIVDLMPNLIGKLDEPLTDTSFLVTFQVSELAHKDVKVILSGVGGDELFGGYRRYLSSGFHDGISWVPQVWRERLGKVLTGTLRADRGTVWGNISRYGKELGKTLHLPLAEQYLSLISVMSAAQVEKIFNNRSFTVDPAKALVQMYHEPRTSASLNRLLYVDSKTVLPESLLLLTDRMGMASSLEVRVPFLDNRIVDFVSKLPSDYRLKGLNLKRLLKAALKGVVPDSVLTRSKRGFGTPMGSWLKNDLRPMVKELLGEKRLNSDGLFNSSLIQEIVASHESGQEDYTEPIFALLAFHIWLDVFHVRLP
jgi:asparagine synthase (glutamine-hydrolysing)